MRRRAIFSSIGGARSKRRRERESESLFVWRVACLTAAAAKGKHARTTNRWRPPRGPQLGRRRQLRLTAKCGCGGAPSWRTRGAGAQSGRGAEFNCAVANYTKVAPNYKTWPPPPPNLWCAYFRREPEGGGGGAQEKKRRRPFGRRRRRLGNAHFARLARRRFDRPPARYSDFALSLSAAALLFARRCNYSLRKCNCSRSASGPSGGGAAV